MFAYLCNCRLFVALAMTSALLMAIGWSALPVPEVAENRRMATWPSSGQLTTDFTVWRKGVDAWITDNFPARRQLIGALNYTRWRLGYSGTGRVVVGAKGWLFYDDTTHLGQVRPSTLGTEDLDAWVGELQARIKLLGATQVPYLVLAAPVKESMYRELVPRFLIEEGTTDSQAISATVRAAGLNNYLDLHPALAAAKGSGVPIFSAYDTHWTGEGAYVAYTEVMHAFLQRGLKAQLQPRAAFRIANPRELTLPQDLAHMLGIASFVRQDYPQLLPINAHSTHITWLGTEQDWTADRVIDTDASGPVLLITGDSFTTAWLPMLERSFSRIVFSHHQNGFFRPDLIDRFKPDAVLLEVIESGIRHAMQQPLPPPQGAPTAPRS